MGLHTKAFTAYACPPRAGVSGRYPVIPPVELSVIRTTVVVRPSAFYRWRTCRTLPEIITGFTISFCICNQCRDQLQYILFRMYVRHRVIMHAFMKVDRIEDFYLVPEVQECFPTLTNNCAFRIRDNK